MEPVIRPNDHPWEDLKWYWKVPMTALALVVIALAVVQLWPDNGSVNITRDEYNAALNKWRSQNITEYEMTTSFSAKGCALDKMVCGTWKLRVSGDKINILEYSWMDGPTTPTAGPSDLDFLTVDSLFREIDATLADGPFAKDGFPLDYTIRFDPTLGYPIEISRQGRQGRNSLLSSEVWHLGIDKEIRSLKMIRSK